VLPNAKGRRRVMTKFHEVVRRTCPQLAEVIVKVEQDIEGRDIKEIACNRAVQLARMLSSDGKRMITVTRLSG
jgi:hypothetical protein